MKRVVFDQGLPPAAAATLRQMGWDAVHVRELGMREASDAEILALATREMRVAVTLDRDFPQILALAGAVNPSVVLIRRERLRTAEILALVISIWQDHETDLDEGCIITVTVRGTRVRKLPLR